MIKSSVKKPFTVLVAVIMVIALGVVSLTSMTADLLPEFSLPYMIVITTYPGAGPEKVEAAISQPMESALGTINGVKTISSNSADNYSTVQLEFNDGTDMNAALVKVSNAIDQVKPYLPEEAGTPSIMEISMDMMASVYMGVAYEGMDQFELSTFVENDLIPYLERQEGVANVNSVGLVSQSIVVELNEAKVQDLNDRILGAANKGFADAYKQLADSKKKLEDAEVELEDGKKEIEENWEKYEDGRRDLEDALDDMDYYVDKLEMATEALPMLIESKSAIIGGLREIVPSRAAIVDTVATADAIFANLYSNYQGATAAGIAMGLNAIHADITTTSAVTITPGSIVSEKLATFTNLCAPVEGAIAAVMAIPEAPSEQLLGLYTSVTGAAMGIAGLDQIARLSEIYTSGSTTQSSITFGALKASIDALGTSVDNGIKQAILSYNTLRELAGLKTVTWSAVNITMENVNEMDEQWSGLWGSASAYSRSSLDTMKAQRAQLEATEAQLDATKTQLESAEDSLKDAKEQIEDGWEQYYDGVKAFNKQRQEVLKTANADQLVSLNTLSQLIYAQNFEMPAGYIDDENDNSWLIKIGENFTKAEDMENIVLTNIHDVGDVRLSDIATITYIDNRGEDYAKINGNDAVLLAIFKSSSASTNAVSDKMKDAKDELEEKYKGLSLVSLLDQGEYIDMLVKSVLESMLLGAGLAVLILALFLKDFIPTVVVAISIPLSVLLSIVCIYFTGLTLNIMTLAGLALGIGMLVDNSIVVIENIYRLRLLGNSAAKASVLGAKEVAAPIISSTLTTICVFLPIIFTNGLVKELILPMCLTVTYCLVASLVIALSVVPAAGSTLLKNSKPKDHKLFDRVMVKYGASLKWCLTHKAIPLILAIGLLGASIWNVIRMGIVMIPEMSTEPIQMSVSLPEEMDKESAYKMIDDIVETVCAVDGVETVGAMPGSALVGTIGGGATGSGDFHNFIAYVLLEGENPQAKTIKRITNDIQKGTEKFDCEIGLSASSMDTSALLGSGLAINIYGDDLDKLVEISEDIMAIVEKVDGYENVTNALEEGDDVVHLKIDKDKAMRCGLSVAQIYADINTRLTEEVKATTLTVNGREMDVNIKKSYSVPKVENLLDMTFNTKEIDADGDSVTVTHKLSDFASVEIEKGLAVVKRENMSRFITVKASIKEGENATLLARELKPLLDDYKAPSGYLVSLGGESDTVNNMVIQMSKLMALGFLFIYLVMVAQFQSLLSPFIILFTIPLGFTGGLLALSICGEQLSLMSIMGFMILMGTVVNNGIVFVDYANQLRIGGLERHEALIETGKTRMRPILMTALTTILAMFKMGLGVDMSGQMGKGMALVIMGGLLYATLMTLYIVPIVYDILFKRKPLVVDIDV